MQQKSGRLICKEQNKGCYDLWHQMTATESIFFKLWQTCEIGGRMKEAQKEEGLSNNQGYTKGSIDVDFKEKG